MKKYLFPIRTEILVLGADNPKGKAIGFSMYERIGRSNLKMKIKYICA